MGSGGGGDRSSSSGIDLPSASLRGEPAAASPQRSDCISPNIPPEDDRTPLQHALTGRPSYKLFATATALGRLPKTVAWRGGCPSRGRRPVPRTDRSARDGCL